MNWRDLHAVNPYKDFWPDDWPSTPKGWNSEDPVFADVIGEVKNAKCKMQNGGSATGQEPMLIVEVGSWLGASAIHMAKAMLVGGPGSIVCVDTWLGSLEFWTNQEDKTRYGELGKRNGYPMVYYKFLANVVRAGLQDVIIPFPQTSAIASRMFHEQKWQPDLVYLDASHEEWDVRVDLEAWYQVLRPGGILFGDDWDDKWPGVEKAVDAFGVMTRGIRPEVRGRKWILRK